MKKQAPQSLLSENEFGPCYLRNLPNHSPMPPLTRPSKPNKGSIVEVAG